MRTRAFDLYCHTCGERGMRFVVAKEGEGIFTQEDAYIAAMTSVFDPPEIWVKRAKENRLSVKGLDPRIGATCKGGSGFGEIRHAWIEVSPVSVFT